MKHSLQRIFIVFNKEVIDNLRDRRSLFSAAMSTLIGPLILLVLIFILGRTVFSDTQETTLDLPFIGAQNAPALVEYLEQNGISIVAAPDDPAQAVRNGDVDIVVVVPENYREDFNRGVPATVRVIHDSSRQSAIAHIERIRNLLENYSGQIAALRLMARGINPIVTAPLAIERLDVATPQSQALIFLNMMPYFVVMVVFMGGMYVIIDTTAGERERGSLEPLLINPVERWEFVLAKLAASWPFAIFTLFLNLMAFAVVFNAFPLEDYIGFQLSIDMRALGGIFLIALPMILLASALQMIIATFTRSFKEAQTYVGFLPLIPALPGIGLAFLPIKSSIWTMLVPTFGQQLLINQLMRGEDVLLANVMISTAVTIILAVVLIYAAIKLYERERVLFGTK